MFAKKIPAWLAREYRFGIKQGQRYCFLMQNGMSYMAYQTAHSMNENSAPAQKAFNRAVKWNA